MAKQTFIDLMTEDGTPNPGTKTCKCGQVLDITVEFGGVWLWAFECLQGCAIRSRNIFPNYVYCVKCGRRHPVYTFTHLGVQNVQTTG